MAEQIVKIRCYNAIDDIFSEEKNKNKNIQYYKINKSLEILNKYKPNDEDPSQFFFTKLIQKFEQYKTIPSYNIQQKINELFDGLVSMRDKETNVKNFLDKFLYFYNSTENEIIPFYTTPFEPFGSQNPYTPLNGAYDANHL